eukprot:1382882-Pyramimonas_sp.AAC.1
MDPDMIAQPQAFEVNPPASTLPEYLHDSHAMMQANMQAAEEARRTARDRNARQMERIAKSSAPRGHAQTTRSTPRSRDGPPPSPYEAEESTLQRHGRTRPNSDALVVSDISFTQCAVRLESFELREKMWRPQCGH